MSDTLRRVRLQLPPRMRGVTLDHPSIASLQVVPEHSFENWREALQNGRVVRAEGYLESCGVGLWVVGRRASDLLAAVLVDAVENLGYRGLYLSVTDYLDSLRPPDADHRFDGRVETDEILVLANVGIESATEWTQATIRSLILKRYEEGLPTLVASHQDPLQYVSEGFAHDVFVPLAIMGSA